MAPETNHLNVAHSTRNSFKFGDKTEKLKHLQEEGEKTERNKNRQSEIKVERGRETKCE